MSLMRVFGRRMRSSAPKMEKVLPLPVWPYAKMVAEYLVGALGCLR